MVLVDDMYELSISMTGGCLPLVSVDTCFAVVDFSIFFFIVFHYI